MRYYLRICGKANEIILLLGEFFKLVSIEDITCVSVDRPVELTKLVCIEDI